MSNKQTIIKDVTKLEIFLVPIWVLFKKKLAVSVTQLNNILVTADHRTFFWQWEENRNEFFYWHNLKQLQRVSSLVWCDITTNSEFFGHWYPPNTHIFSKYQASSSRSTQENISVNQRPHKGTIANADISVHLLKFQFACTPFRSNLVSLLFHSDHTAVFIFRSSASCFSPLVKSEFCGSFKVETLISSNEEILFLI